MTWLSRLLTQKTSLQHPGNGNRIKQARRRQALSLERLEDRKLLANTSFVYDPLAFTLNITSDSSNNSYTLTEASTAAGGAVTITANNPVTTIGPGVSTMTTPGPVRSISINLLSSANPNLDKIIIIGPGKTVPETVQNTTITAASTTGTTLIGLSVNNVNNTGTFSVNTTGIIAGPGTPAQLRAHLLSRPASITNSTFGTLSIVQNTTGLANAAGITANVSVSNVTVNAATTITEGGGNGD